jgi:hypothetical protein
MKGYKRSLSLILILVLLFAMTVPLSGAGADNVDNTVDAVALGNTFEQLSTEDNIMNLPEAMFDVHDAIMDRGMLVAEVDNGVFISWRFFPQEATGFYDYDGEGGRSIDGPKRLLGADFVIYRNGTRITPEPITTSTNFLDPVGEAGDEYVVVTVANGVYISRSKATTAAPRLMAGFTEGRAGREIAGYFEFPVHMPPDAVMPSDTVLGETTSWPYFIDKMTAGDLDGDGQLDIVLRLKGRSPDTTQIGFTPPIIHQGYRLSFDSEGALVGTILWEVDLGINVRAGQHYSQPMLYNFDGSGAAQLIVGTAPGARWRSFENGIYRDFNDDTWEYINMPEDDFHRMWDVEARAWRTEFTHQDDFRSFGPVFPPAQRDQSEIFAILFGLFYSWHEHPEVRAAHYGPELSLNHFENRSYTCRVDCPDGCDSNGEPVYGFGWWKYPPQVILNMFPAGFIGEEGPIPNAGVNNVFVNTPAVPGWTIERWQLLNSMPKCPIAFREHEITLDEAEALAYLFLRHRNNNVGGAGFVFDGPQYMTVFCGQTGQDLDSVPMTIPRGVICPETGNYFPDFGIMWKDLLHGATANRMERHRGAVAYLDGSGNNASAIHGRGYYGAAFVSRYDWDGENLTGRVISSSGHEISRDPFVRDRAHFGMSRNTGTGPGRSDGFVTICENGIYTPHPTESLTFNPDEPITWQIRENGMPGPTMIEQGGRVITIFDVDNDGYDEIVLGGYTLNSDGSLRHATYYWNWAANATTTVVGTPGSGAWSRMGHGNDTHAAFFHPSQAYPALWNNGLGRATHNLQNLDTGEIMYSAWRGSATGANWGGNIGQGFRGIVGKFTSEPGWQLFGNGGPQTTAATNFVTMENVNGLLIGLRPDGHTSGGLRQWDGSGSRYVFTHTPPLNVNNPSPGPGTNWSIQFRPDLTRQTISGSADAIGDLQVERKIAAGVNPGLRIQSFNSELVRFVDVVNTRDTIATGGTKGQVFTLDILGDYREEMVVGTTNAAGSYVRIYFNTEESEYKLATLMADRRYRVEITRQHSSYGRPAYTGFYLGTDMWMDVYFDSIGATFISRDELRDILEDASDLTRSNFSAANWRLFTPALNHAQSVYVNPNSTQAEIDNAMNTLSNLVNRVSTNQID